MGVQEMKVAVSGDPQDAITPKDIFLRLRECRDFEIKLQWERAVFLTAFLIACYAGYGGLILSVIQHGFCCLSKMTVSIIFEVLAVIGIVLSLLWIMMAKGSKAWYEHYEMAIKAYAKQVTDEHSQDIAGGQLISVPYIEGQPIDKCPFSTSGGPFSVSRIVIVIGVCSLLFWSLAFIAHIFFAFCDIGKLLNKTGFDVFLFSMISIGMIIIVWQIWAKCRSGYLLEVRKLPIGQAESVAYYMPFIYSKEPEEISIAAASKINNDTHLIIERECCCRLYHVKFRQATEMPIRDVKRFVRVVHDRMNRQYSFSAEDGICRVFGSYIGSFADSQNSKEV